MLSSANVENFQLSQCQNYPFSNNIHELVWSTSTCILFTATWWKHFPRYPWFSGTLFPNNTPLTAPYNEIHPRQLTPSTHWNLYVNYLNNELKSWTHELRAPDTQYVQLQEGKYIPVCIRAKPLDFLPIPCSYITVSTRSAYHCAFPTISPASNINASTGNISESSIYLRQKSHV